MELLANIVSFQLAIIGKAFRLEMPISTRAYPFYTTRFKKVERSVIVFIWFF